MDSVRVDVRASREVQQLQPCYKLINQRESRTGESAHMYDKRRNEEMTRMVHTWLEGDHGGGITFSRSSRKPYVSVSACHHSPVLAVSLVSPSPRMSSQLCGGFFLLLLFLFFATLAYVDFQQLSITAAAGGCEEMGGEIRGSGGGEGITGDAATAPVGRPPCAAFRCPSYSSASRTLCLLDSYIMSINKQH